jgi:hypothetical protein
VAAPRSDVRATCCAWSVVIRLSSAPHGQPLRATGYAAQPAAQDRVTA